MACSLRSQYFSRIGQGLAASLKLLGFVTVRFRLAPAGLLTEDLCRPPLAPPFKLLRIRRSSDRSARSTAPEVAPTGSRLSLSSCWCSSRFSSIKAETKGSSSARTCSADCDTLGPWRAKEDLLRFLLRVPHLARACWLFLTEPPSSGTSPCSLAGTPSVWHTGAVDQQVKR